MAAEGEERQPEIIIVRRGGDEEEEGHHGGVWKIAFADFMTAMMCFFLVMWLINAANEQTRIALASYFNPVKLVDRNTSRKGLEDMGHGPQAAPDPDKRQKSGEKGGDQDKTSGPLNFLDAEDLSETEELSDENFFSDPYSALSEIAERTGSAQNISRKGDGGERTAGPSSGASGGEAYRDPFAPDFWSQQVAEPQAGVQGDPDKAREHPAGVDKRAAETGEYRLSARSESDAAENAGDAAPASGSRPQNETSVALAPVAKVEPTAEEARADVQQKSAAASPARSEEMAADEAAQDRRERADKIDAAIAEALESSDLATAVDVSASNDGVLISITDDMEEGMFSVGSAVPERTLVLAMERIGRILGQESGAVRIHGHTDGRPFANGDYDNWRLSTARAHAAHYMLVRGGLDEARVAEVAGFADKRLKLPGEPFAGANRRIEILLETPQ